MATQDDVRRIALSLPGVMEAPDHFEFAVENRGKHKSFAWAWRERVAPRQPKVPNPGVLAVRVGGEEQKQFLVGSIPSVFFTEPHYNGFPAVLVRLAAIDVEQLEPLLIDAWTIQAPKSLVAAYRAATA